MEDLTAYRLFTFAQLRADGVTRATIRRGVREGALIRVRKGSYVRGDCPIEALEAARQGGQVDCVSMLRLLGVFVLDQHRPHIRISHGQTRVRERSIPGVVRHWRDTPTRADSTLADLVGAIAQACRCQPPRAAVATLDSALHLGILDRDWLHAVFRMLPRRYRALEPLLDARSEAGTESLVRLLLRGHGILARVQVQIEGVGRVDLLVDGWLIIECDSRAFHEGWASQQRDRERDRAAAERGFTTLRLLATDCLWHPERVLAAVDGLRRARAGQHNVASTPPVPARAGR